MMTRAADGPASLKYGALDYNSKVSAATAATAPGL